MFEFSSLRVILGFKMNGDKYFLFLSSLNRYLVVFSCHVFTYMHFRLWFQFLLPIIRCTCQCDRFFPGCFGAHQSLDAMRWWWCERWRRDKCEHKSIVSGWLFLTLLFRAHTCVHLLRVRSFIHARRFSFVLFYFSFGIFHRRAFEKKFFSDYAANECIDRPNENETTKMWNVFGVTIPINLYYLFASLRHSRLWIYSSFLSSSSLLLGILECVWFFFTITVNAIIFHIWKTWWIHSRFFHIPQFCRCFGFAPVLSVIAYGKQSNIQVGIDSFFSRSHTWQNVYAYILIIQFVGWG